MQSLGGPDQTLGFILAAVGVGCVVGPLFVNSITPGVARCWRISIAAAFGLLAAGYAVMAAASSIMWILPASSIRTAGSTIIYIHSFAILQHRLHEGIRGRVFAVEFVLFTISEASSSLAAGWALDGLGWSTHRLSATIACVATGFMVGTCLSLLERYSCSMGGSLYLYWRIHHGPWQRTNTERQKAQRHVSTQHPQARLALCKSRALLTIVLYPYAGDVGVAGLANVGLEQRRGGRTLRTQCESPPAPT